MTAYHRQIPIFWWTERRSYLLFVLRELSSVFVAWFVVYLLLLLIKAVGDGPAAYERYLDWSARPWMLVVNVIALLFVLLHAVTWFGLAPKAMVVKLHGRRVPPRMILIAHYLAWLVLSAIVAWVILR